MKNLLITIMCLALSINSFSQEKCKYEKNEVDPFTKSKVVISEWVDYSNSLDVYGRFKLQFTDNTYTLFFSCNFYTNIAGAMSVEKGQDMIILLENGDTIISHSNTDILGSTINKASFSGKFYATINSNYNIINGCII